MCDFSSSPFETNTNKCWVFYLKLGIQTQLLRRENIPDHLIH